MGYDAPIAASTIDTDAIGQILADQDRLAIERSFYEPAWKEIDLYIDPFGMGGFDKSKGSPIRDVETLYDVTAIDGLDRYTAAITGLTIPRGGQRWHGVEFDDKDLMKIAAVKRWCQHATDRLFTARYAPGTGFETQAIEDIRQEGKYGSSALWVGEKLGAGLFYKSLHLSEIFFDEDYCGGVDRVHRLYTTTILKAYRECSRNGGMLSDKSMVSLEDAKKRNDEIVILHVVRPNLQYEPGYFGAKGKPVESLYIEVDQKHLIRRSGYRKMPALVSRHITGPRDVYGRSPAMKALATVKGLQSMGRTILDQGNRAVDPPLLYSDDSDITKIVTKPGGLTAGGVNENGKPLVVPLYTGAQIAIGMEMQNNDREVVKKIFLEELFMLLSNPSDRMTATQVIEQLKKEGVLVAPFAGRRENEKLGPQIERELEIMMNAGAIDPMPPEALEAGLKPKVRMTNPLSRMARAEEVSGFTRTVEIAVQAASAGAPEALEVINFEEGIRDTADVLGARPTHIYSPEEVADRRQARQDKEAAAAGVEAAPKVADAALSLARANDLAAGGGLG
jgi:hypothetical protein